MFKDVVIWESMPDKITGYQSIEADDIRAKFEKEYGVKLNPKAGKDNHEMVEGIHDGEVHSLYLYGEDTGIVDQILILYKLRLKN